MGKLYSSREIISVLQKHGYVHVSTKGSHKKFRKGSNVVIVPDPKKEIPIGTFHSILKQSKLERKDFP